MKKTLFLIFFISNLISNLNAAKISVEELTWARGETLLTFFENNNIPLNLYYNLEKEDQELANEIVSGVKFQILRNDNGSISQALIPVSEELQIHIIKNKLGKYEIDFIPIIYETEERVFSIALTKSPYQDIESATGSTKVANAFIAAFRGNVDFKGLKKGDRLVIAYKQKRRMGKAFGEPDIHAAMIEVRGKFEYTYQFKDKFYDENARELDKFFLIKPVKEARVSSPFNPKRFHPILKRYRAHLGIDYAAPKGTKIHAAGDGVVTFAGRKSGYGNVLTIKHSGTYTTLYAHLNGFAKGIKNGMKVRQGQVVAYVGSTGMSTGPHLHIGLSRNNVAINPNSVVKISKGGVDNKEKAAFNAVKNKFTPILKAALDPAHVNPPREESFDNVVSF